MAFGGNQFYMQTYAVGIGALSSATSAFVTNMSGIVTGSMPGVQFGAYAGYVECVVVFPSFLFLLFLPFLPYLFYLHRTELTLPPH
jgi:hypothetical protein